MQQFPFLAALMQEPLLQTFYNCSAQSDQVFGPVSDCRYDFTLFFEQSILSTVPAGILLLASSFRLFHLYRESPKTVFNYVRVLKLVLSLLYIGLQVALLIAWNISFRIRNKATIASSIINLLAAVDVAILSYLEHARSITPSAILETFLLFSVLLDIPQLKTLSVVDGKVQLIALLAASMIARFALVVVEGCEKTDSLRPEYRGLPSESKAGVINRSLQWWLNPLIIKGTKKILVPDDLEDLDFKLTADYWRKPVNAAWDINSEPPRKLSLVITLWSILKVPLAGVVLPRLCLTVFTFMQPLLISRLLSLVSSTKEISKDEVYALIALALLVYIGMAISHLQSEQKLNRLTMMFRSSLISLIFDQSLLLEDDGRQDHAQSMTLMSSDVDRVGFGLMNFNECWIRPIELVIGLYLLTRQVGWVSVMPLVVIAISTIGSSILAGTLGQAQMAWAASTQDRLAVTTSFLSDMKSVKMTGLIESIGDSVRQKRDTETQRFQSFAMNVVWLNVIANLPHVMGTAVTFAAYSIRAHIMGSGALDVTQAFTSIALISLVATPASQMLALWPIMLSYGMSLQRIQTFLQKKKRVDTRICLNDIDDLPPANGSSSSSTLGTTEAQQKPASATTLREINPKVMVKMGGVTVRPTTTADLVFEDANLTIYEKSIIAITGPVASGKTTMLKAILGEIPCEKGNVIVQTREMGYCAQTSWLINGTVREAICGYTANVDDAWYATVVEACDLSQDLDSLPLRDQTVIGSKGVSLSGGQKQRIALARAIYSRPKVVLLDDVLSALDPKTERFILGSLFGVNGLFRKAGTTVIIATHAAHHLQMVDEVVVLLATDTTVRHGPYDEVKQLGLIEAVAEQDESKRHEGQREVDPKSNRIPETDEKGEGKESELGDLTRKLGDFSVYAYYFKFVRMSIFAAFILCIVLEICISTFGYIWLKWWADGQGRDTALYVVVYLFLGLVYPLTIAGSIWTLMAEIAPNTGRTIHNLLLKIVMGAPYSFFARLDRGTLLARFNNDLRMIEFQLAQGLIVTFSNLLNGVGDAVLVCLGSYYMVTTVPILLLCVYILQYLYLQTSRQLRLLDMEARAPTYTHFLETLEGVVTVRAFSWERAATADNIKKVNTMQKPTYTLASVQKWLSLVLDLMMSVMGVVVVALALNLRASTSAGLLGIALNNVLSFSNSLKYSIQGWTLLETSLGAVGRIRDFEKSTPQEKKPGEDVIPPKDWPSRGEIVFKNITASHNPEATALHNISITIKPGQRVAICGRSGSGKSSFISTILRLLEIDSGTITIDSLDIATLPRDTIRYRLNTLPQDALFLPGTIARNLDPHSLFTSPSNPSDNNATLTSALQKTNLLEPFTSRSLTLSSPLDPSTLSAGQQQLFALTRAILHKSKILILDEATSSVDAETERTMRKLIAEEFQACTVLTVAHRPETILDSDLVVVMDEGKVAEIGPPNELMEKEGGKLRDLLAH